MDCFPANIVYFFWSLYVTHINNVSLYWMHCSSKCCFPVSVVQNSYRQYSRNNRFWEKNSENKVTFLECRVALISPYYPSWEKVVKSCNVFEMYSSGTYQYCYSHNASPRPNEKCCRSGGYEGEAWMRCVLIARVGQQSRGGQMWTQTTAQFFSRTVQNKWCIRENNTYGNDG
jgi:hypothetical protein